MGHRAHMKGSTKEPVRGQISRHDQIQPKQQWTVTLKYPLFAKDCLNCCHRRLEWSKFSPFKGTSSSLHLEHRISKPWAWRAEGKLCQGFIHKKSELLAFKINWLPTKFKTQEKYHILLQNHLHHHISCIAALATMSLHISKSLAISAFLPYCVSWSQNAIPIFCRCLPLLSFISLHHTCCSHMLFPHTAHKSPLFRDNSEKFINPWTLAGTQILQVSALFSSTY